MFAIDQKPVETGSIGNFRAIAISQTKPDPVQGVSGGKPLFYCVYINCIGPQN